MANVDEEITDPNYNPEEEVAEGNWKIVDLPAVTVDNGEKDEEEVFKARVKLYRWNDKQWKERGIGDIRILHSKDNGKYRCVLRQEQTMKVRCNFFIHGEGLCKLEKLNTAEKSWHWTAADFSEGSLSIDRFCVRFKTNEEFDDFEKKFNQGFEENKKANWTSKPTEKKAEENKADGKDSKTTNDEPKKEDKKEEKKSESTETEKKADTDAKKE